MVCLVGQGEPPCLCQFAQDAPEAGGGQVVDPLSIAPEVHKIVRPAGDHLHVQPVDPMLTEEGGAVDPHPDCGPVSLFQRQVRER